jgi:demethylmenaquinone methyltransferase / 2-methoxy-6-polyprenyl-1,4-benzoquinol methylase
VPDSQPANETEHANRVRAMFADIAGRYDLLNHLLSGHVDKRWRRIVARKLQGSIASNGARILDVACGTGDLSLTLSETTGARVVATDFCRPMLEIAARKTAKSESAISLIEGDALRLPFRDCSFEAVTIAFGLRNLSDVERGLAELLRVIKPGGYVAVLEFSKPVVPGFRRLFNVYFTRVLPFLGGLISGSKSAYQYLPDSVTRFPDQRELSSMMLRVGLESVEYENLTGGIAALHTGKRPK